VKWLTLGNMISSLVPIAVGPKRARERPLYMSALVQVFGQGATPDLGRLCAQEQTWKVLILL